MDKEKRAHGIKMIFSTLKKRCRIIWYGNPVKKINSFINYWGNIPSAKNGNLLEREESRLNQYKAQFEIARLDRMKKNYENGSDVWLFEIQESGIRKIEIGVLEWFKSEWLKDETINKRRFYLWMEADYLEHFEQYVKHKNAYFKDLSVQNKYEAYLVGTERMTALIGCIITFFVGKNANKIFRFFSNSTIFKGVYKWPAIVVCVLLAFLILFFLYCRFKTLFKAEYTRRDNLLRQQKETWIRHVEAIANYQKEMFGYLWDLYDYQNCIVPQEKEELFMNNILNVWMNDNMKFQSNMSKQNEEIKRAQ